MAKQLNVNLAFTADTGKAKQQMDDLSASLNRLMANAGKSAGGLGLTQELAAATNEVAKLQSMLDASKNAFGGLDLGKFHQSLKQNGIEITDYAKTLSSLGPVGDQAFAKLARSIVQAEVPLKRTSGLLSEFKTTLMNTARWQISSSILHGFMGALQGAYGYAQDLNESLNNIRIVTGYGKDEMAAFAEQANKAAKALSTTTTEYTNASLIYYQQGLSAEEVQKRTDITVKMANVARQSAEVVSDQMTAVWNNFYDGTKALEYYADVMTALGAKTASSTDEIAGGLEKFAAIGDTIGLSYEYAASALATITSNTRQSEEVVGTALKTIFARIQGLNLGETLDDGTTLNKYSEALNKVGISIFDQAGELKTMDALLDEMGNKWNTLNSAQQTALAQTVAGVRQYTQLVALMENWDNGDEDSFQTNLDTAYNATGALQEQADIYAESWEAAEDRVTAALEEIYNQLLNDDFFIGITDGFADFLNVVSNTIDSLGGLSGVLTVASSIMFKMFGKDMATMIDNWAYNLKNKTQGAKRDILEMRQDMIQSVKTLYANSADDGPVTGASATAFREQAFLADALLQKQQELVKKGQQLSETDKQQVQYLLQINEALGDQAIQAAKNLEIAGQHGDEIENQLKKLVKNNNASGKKIDYNASIAPQVEEAKKLQKEFSSLEAIYNRLQVAYGKKPDMDTEPLIQDLQAIREAAENANLDVTQFDRALEALKGSSNIGEALGSIETEMYEIGAAADQASQEIREAFDGSGVDLKKVDAILDQLYDSWVQQGIITADVAQKLKSVGVQAKDAGEKIKEMDGPPPSLGQKIVAVGNLLSNVAMSISSIQGLFDTWNNEDMSFGEKLISTFTTLGTVIPMVTSSLMGNNLAMLGSASASVATALGFNGVAISAKVAAGGVGALWAALWPIALVAAGVAAALAGIVAVAKAVADEYNKDAIAAERAAEAAKELAKANEEAKQSLSDIESAFDTYDSAVEALEACTEGTEEWNDALNKVNETVLDLMDQYPELLKDADIFTRNEITGMLELNREKQQEILDELEKQVTITQAASLFGSANASKKAAISQQTDLSRDIGSMSLATYSKNINGQQSVVTEFFHAGKILTDNATELADLTEEEYRKKIGELIRKSASDQAKTQVGFDDQVNKLVDKCVEYQNSIDILVDNTEAAANQMANVAQIMADQVLGDEYDSAEKTMAGYDLATRTEDLTDAYLKLFTSNANSAKAKAAAQTIGKASLGSVGISQTSDETNKIYKEALEGLQKAGYNWTATTNNAVRGNDNNRRFVFTDESGKQTEELSAEWVATTVAAAVAMEELSGSAEKAKETLETMDANISKNSIGGSGSNAIQSEALRGFIASKNFENTNMGDFETLYSQISKQGGAEEYAKAIFGENGKITDEIAQEYGYKTAESFISAFASSLEGMSTAWETIELPDNLIGADNLKFSAAKALSDAFYSIEIGPIGEKAGEQFAEGLNKMIKDLNADDQTSALNALANVDWSNWDALDQASTLMAEYGVNIDITSDYWKTFAENMRKATNAIPDFSKLQKTLTAVAGVLADLNFGDVIDDEAYQTLIAYNAAWEEFFIMQADGSRKFIGSNELMLQAVRDRTNAEIESLKQRKAAQDAFNSARWGYTDENGERQLTDWSKVEGTNVGTARNLMNASGKTQATLEYLNYNDERIAELIAQAESSDEKIKTEGQAALKKMYDAIATLLGEDLETALDETYEQIASLAPDLKTLKSMLTEQEIDQAAYDKQLKSLLYAELEAAESYKQLNDALELARTHGIEWEPQYYAEKLKEIALNGIEAATSITELAIALQQAALHGAEISFDDYKEKLKELALGNLEAAASIEELQTAFVSSQQISVNGENFSTGIDYEDYADNLIRLGEAYDNCKKEVEDFKRALANKKDVDAMEDSLEASIRLAEAAEKYGFEAKELEVQSRQLAKAYNLTAAAAAKLAVQNQRMNKGIVTLAENWKKWNKALTEAGTDTTDFAEAVIDCTAAVADLVGASADLELPDEFFNTENLALIEQAINGNIDAINRLGIEVALTQLEAVELNEAFATLAEETLSEADGADYLGVLAENFATDVALIQQSLIDLKNSSLNITTEMSAEWVAALNRMALATGMSVENMNDLLGSMGVQAKVTTTYVKQPMEIPTYTDHYEEEYYNAPEFNEQNEMIRPASWSSRRYTIPGEPIKVEGYAAVAQISTEDNPLTLDIDQKTVEGSPPSTSSSGGGATWTPNRGKIAPSTTEAVKETQKVNVPDLKDRFEADDDELKKIEDEIERYYEVLNELEVVEDNLETISKAKDQAYGANKIALIDQETAALKRQLEVQREYIRQIKEYLKQDKDKLSTYGFMFNDDGNITNYEEIMQQQIEAYNAAYQAYINAKNAAVDTWNAATRGGPSEEADAAYDAAIKAADQLWETAQEKYETFQKELDLYDQTLEKMREAQQIEQDIINAVKAANFEKIQYKLEIKLEINDAEMRMLDYYLNKLSDDFYSMAEAAQLMVDKIPLMTDALSSYESFYNEIEAAYAAGDISQEDYVAGLKQSYDGILDNLEALNELDKEMMHYYEDTLAAGAEELAHYTDQMEHLTSVLDHYYNLIVLINGEYDYDSIGTVLEGKATTLKNEMDVAQANYQMLLEQKAMIQSHYDNAVDENARELHANELKAITAMVDEAHEVLLSKTEEWAKVQKAIMENVMAEAAREMEMAFTNGMGFDALNDSLGRLSAIADIYLTKTNQIYETQTLLNTAQKAIDKTTNNAAKIRLKNYQDEIALLQDKNKLTKVELDIAKAKYDVLLAEIALEEAQNAKATVRLQRDNEGNYGYVYTADQEKVTEAEQNLLDTQNELYNIRLEAANEYGQKIMELNQQLADDLMALEQARVDGQFATEAEYQAAKEKIIAEYTELYKGYSASYTAATSEDARIEEEAWVTAYEGIIDSAGNWKDHIRIYTRECENAYSEYRSVVQSESSVINNLLGDVQGSVKDVTNESNNLKNKVLNEVIPSIRNQYTQVAQVTAAYAAQRTGILNLISAYEQLAQSILRAMQAQANLNALEQTPTGPTTTSAPTNTNKTPTNNTSQEDTSKNQKAAAIASRAQEIVTKVHTGVIPMHSSGLGWQPSAREMGYDEDSIRVALQAFNDSKPGAGWDYYYDIALQLAARYKTGGYTGVWGPEGRIALLDEKELVLNQHDTENFLMATEILRGIVDTIDFNSFHSQFSQLSSTGLLSMNSGSLEQNVSIEAHFPNVSDRNEIEEAFNNLINTASQYANRKF